MKYFLMTLFCAVASIVMSFLFEMNLIAGFEVQLFFLTLVFEIVMIGLIALATYVITFEKCE